LLEIDRGKEKAGERASSEETHTHIPRNGKKRKRRRRRRRQ
jgi:hypothetical protein